MAPVGRPLAHHKFIDGIWVHVSTGEPYDRRTHAALLKARKRDCMQRAYWECGGRQKRLDRYVRKRRPKDTQLTLSDDITSRAADHTTAPTNPSPSLPPA